MEVLDLPSNVWATFKVDLRAVKLKYRRTSLLLHPDKCKHPQARQGKILQYVYKDGEEEKSVGVSFGGETTLCTSITILPHDHPHLLAFELLKEAEMWLMDDGQRGGLLQMMMEARGTVFKQYKINVKTPHSLLELPKDIEEEEQDKSKDDTHNNDNSKTSTSISDHDSTLVKKYDQSDIEASVKVFSDKPDVLLAIKVELRKMLREMHNKNEVKIKNEVERQARLDMERNEERKRKAEHDQKWEESRDVRVDSWRNFQKKGAGKKTKKKKDDW